MTIITRKIKAAVKKAHSFTSSIPSDPESVSKAAILQYSDLTPTDVHAGMLELQEREEVRILPDHDEVYLLYRSFFRTEE